MFVKTNFLQTFIRTHRANLLATSSRSKYHELKLPSAAESLNLSFGNTWEFSKNSNDKV